ncbi:hypothetical protein HYW87_01265 [Candidatus Roizmanbacteria bacterium]|nr:hypothetical protein [Candidatus Roizmanbacteria bacterium]
MEKSRILRAFVITLLIFASAHLAILYTSAFYTGDIERINVFRLLDLQLFFPDIHKGFVSFVLSYASFLLLFLLIFFFVTKPKR